MPKTNKKQASNPDTPIKDLEVIIYPELAAAADQRGELAFYIYYSILRAISKANHATGYFPVNTLMNVIHKVKGVGTNTLYTELKKGEGKYWNKIGGQDGRRATSIVSLKRLTHYLHPTMVATMPYVIPIKSLLPEGMNRPFNSRIKGLITAMIASRHADLRPVSRASVQDHTGRSRATIWRRLQSCNEVQIKKNFEKILAGGTRHEAEIFLCNFLKGQSQTAGNPWRITRMDGKFYLCRQIPNSYHLEEFARKSMRSRPRELRAFDVDNALQCDTQLYFEDDADTGEKSDKLRYKAVSEKQFARLGRVGMWDAQREIMPDVIPLPTNNRERWQANKRLLKHQRDTKVAAING